MVPRILVGISKRVCLTFLLLFAPQSYLVVGGYIMYVEICIVTGKKIQKMATFTRNVAERC